LKQTACYIHVPFCEHKCIYCDFYSIIRHDDLDGYLSALLHEISIRSSEFGDDRIITSVYFGGGTPSLLSPAGISAILNCLQRSFHFSDNPEITLEANPGTLSDEKLKGYIDCGINRLSIGVQSFEDSELKLLTRIHNSDCAVSTVKKAAESGFANLSIDLIFNLPGTTKKIWENNLEKALSLPIKHLSTYSLILERGTILNKLVLDGKLSIGGNEFDSELYGLTIEFLSERGFRQYEVSNFCLPGFECRHNKTYWQYGDYLGFGPSAHSFAEGKRWWNFSGLNFYISGLINKRDPVAGKEILTVEQQQEEFIMLALRSEGLHMTEFRRKFGNSWLERNATLLKLLEKEGFIQKDAEFIRFSGKGYRLCDEILLRFN